MEWWILGNLKRIAFNHNDMRNQGDCFGLPIIKLKDIKYSSRFNSKQVSTFWPGTNQSFWSKGVCTLDSMSAQGIIDKITTLKHSHRRDYSAFYWFNQGKCYPVPRSYRCNLNLIRSMQEKQHASKKINKIKLWIVTWKFQKCSCFKQQCGAFKTIYLAFAIPNMVDPLECIYFNDRKSCWYFISINRIDANDLTHFFLLSHFIIHLWRRFRHY